MHIYAVGGCLLAFVQSRDNRTLKHQYINLNEDTHRPINTDFSITNEKT